MSPLPTADSADILLLLEGTFPYVKGGVSNWVEQLIKSHPNHKFACIFLGSNPEAYAAGLLYDLPENIVHLEIHYLYSEAEHIDADKLVRLDGNKAAFKPINDLHEYFKGQEVAFPSECQNLQFFLDAKQGVNEHQFLHSRAAWQFICEQYEKYCDDPSFLDYFWTVRNMHRPLWLLAQVADNCPKVKVIHSVSTGYAGLLGEMLQRDREIPFVLSEHGIYTKERRIDLLQSHWLDFHRHALDHDPTKVNYFRQLWIRFYEAIGKMTYQVADPIISLFDTYRQQQIKDGAAVKKTKIIANGVDVQYFKQLAKQRKPFKSEQKHIVGLVGRVVPIKDIKNFIRAMKIMQSKQQNFEAWIVGPYTEAQDYYIECQQLIQSLQLDDIVKFTGNQDMAQIYPELSLLVLSSISEGLPLVMLEAMAAGLPMVTTDVGACRELIYGKNTDDAEFGACGMLTHIGDPTELATAIESMLSDDERWQGAQAAGFKRVAKYYNKQDIFAQYANIYQSLLSNKQMVSV